MADAKEWYSVGSVEFPNQEAAFAEAEFLAKSSERPIEVHRWTRAVVRRYTRQVTVVPEDVSTLDA